MHVALIATMSDSWPANVIVMIGTQRKSMMSGKYLYETGRWEIGVYAASEKISVVIKHGTGFYDSDGKMKAPNQCRAVETIECDDMMKWQKKPVSSILIINSFQLISPKYPHESE